MPLRHVFLTTIAVILLGACDAPADVEPPRNERPDDPPPGSYEFDPEQGETRARLTDEQGNVVSMRSGKRVPVLLPDGYSVFPGAKVIDNARVARSGHSLILLTFDSDRPVSEIVEYYRREAEAGGVDVAIEVATRDQTTIAGRSPDGIDFSFSARAVDGGSIGQLSIGRGGS